jgi:Flp pilus assembly protein TadG
LLRHRVVNGLRRRSGEEDGFTLVFVALTVVMLFTFVAIVIDLGNVRQVARQAQNAADAGVLAGAQDLTSCDGTSGSCGSTATALDHAAKYAASTVNSQAPVTLGSGPAGVVATTCYTAGSATGAPSIRITSPYQSSNQ